MQRVIFVVSVVLAALFSVSARADWAEAQYSKEYNDCVGSCQTNPNIPGQTGKCPSYCSCVVGGLRQQFPDYAGLYRSIEGGSPSVRGAVQTTIANCNRDIFGGEVRKLDFDKVKKPQ